MIDSIWNWGMAYWHYVAYAAGVYTTGAILFLLWVKLDVDQVGQPFLNPKRLHFKITKPLLTKRQIRGAETVSICPYYLRFVIMLFGWPIFWTGVFVLTIFKVLVHGPFMVLFGYYPIPNMESMRRERHPFAVDAGEFNLPKFHGYKLFPAYIVLPSVYLWILINYSQVKYWSAGISVVVALACVVGWYLDTDNEKISMSRVWLSSKKDNLCKPLPVKNPKATA